jgi:hypothetical protein
MDSMPNEIAFYKRVKVKITCKLKIVKKIITVKIKSSFVELECEEG